MTGPIMCCLMQVVVPYMAIYSLSLCHAECLLRDTCTVRQCNVVSCALDCLKTTPSALDGPQYLNMGLDLVGTACYSQLVKACIYRAPMCSEQTS